MEKIIFLISFWAFSLIACATPNTASFATPNYKNLDSLESVDALFIKRFNCADEFAKESIVNGLTDGLLSKGITVVNSEESADAFIEGVASLANDIATSGSAGGSGGVFGSSAFSESAGSAGQYVNNIAVKIVNKRGELLGTAQVSQTRTADSTPYAPAYEGRRLGLAVAKLFDKNEQKIWRTKLKSASK